MKPTKPTPCSAGALARYLAASLLFTSLPLAAQSVTNAGFEDDTFTVFPGYASGNGGAITGWTSPTPDRVGLNPAGSSPFANNGAIPEGTNVAFLQATGAVTPSLQTTISGLTPDTKYNVSFRVNARTHDSQNRPFLVFSTDGDGPAVAAEVSRVSIAPDATEYRTVAYEFTATGESHTITLTNTKPTVAPPLAANGDHTLLVDDVKVTPSTGAWDFSPWTGDEDSGIDPDYVYTHAFKLGSTANMAVNGVTFFGRNGQLPGLFTWTGLGAIATFGEGVLQITDTASAALANPIRYNGDPSITLQNLKPDTEYVFTLYGAGWDAQTPTAYHRTATFGSSLGGDKLTVNLNQYGRGAGMKVNYTYTTDAAGSPVTISYPSTSPEAGTFHTSAFSNREASPRASDVAWSVHPWSDDESSGVSPNHVYTHAHNYNSTLGQNINGVNFTGITGTNPAGVNCAATGFGSGFTNDPNAVTGYGATVAKDFLYNGSPAGFSLSGLTPGKQYVFTLYTMGWNDGLREAALYGGLGESAAILNQDEYGDNQGVRFECLYTADAAGTAKISVHGITDIGGVRSIHTYGTSNREADAMTGVAPSITLQPVGASIGVGSDYLLRAAAIGSAELTYQWKQGAEDVPGADGPELLLEDVDASHAGDYTVVVTNGEDSVTSDTATVSVLENVPGVFGTGVGHDGQPLANGATDPHFTLIVNPDALIVNPDDPEATIVQSNVPGSWVPNSATSMWIGPRANTEAAAAMDFDAGEGPGTYVYRTRIDLAGFDLSTVQIIGSWATDNSGLAIRVNGTDTDPAIANLSPGNTFGVLTSFTINAANAGLQDGVNTIDFVVRNEDTLNGGTGFTGLRIDNLHAIGVIPPGTPPHIAAQPQGGAGPHNDYFTLSVGAIGSAPVTYKWYKNGELLSGEESATLDVLIDSLAAGGDFKVVVTNDVDSVESAVATVTVTNANPVANDDELTTDKNVDLEISPTFDMLANDTDADGDTLTLAGFSAASFAGGTITENEGILTYTPPTEDFVGLDGFTYTVSDGWGGTSAPGTVLITVNNVANPEPGQLTLVLDLTGGTVTGTFTGTPGASYTLQRSTTLEAESWIDIDTQVAPESGIVTIIDDDPQEGRAFYRISYTE